MYSLVSESLLVIPIHLFYSLCVVFMAWHKPCEPCQNVWSPSTLYNNVLWVTPRRPHLDYRWHTVIVNCMLPGHFLCPWTIFLQGCITFHKMPFFMEGMIISRGWGWGVQKISLNKMCFFWFSQIMVSAVPMIYTYSWFDTILQVERKIDRFWAKARKSMFPG